MTRALPTNSLIQSEFQYLQKLEKYHPYQRTFILHNNNSEKLLTN